MRDRIEALGGKLNIASSPGHGTKITGEIPAQALPVAVAGLAPHMALVPDAVEQL
jgi:signal transduction histidine kinase